MNIVSYQCCKQGDQEKRGRKAKDMHQQSFKKFLQRHHKTVLRDPTGCMATSNYKRCSDLHPMCLVKIRASINTKEGKIVESRVK